MHDQADTWLSGVSFAAMIEPHASGPSDPAGIAFLRIKALIKDRSLMSARNVPWLGGDDFDGYRAGSGGCRHGALPVDVRSFAG
jgi:hypothetical protein